MPDLHLIGVHEDGEHLLLASEDGRTEYRLPLDDALRSTLRWEQGHPHGAGSPHTPMRPTEVQAMIRAGATAQEAAERAAWPVEKVHRYEGPILAERAHIATLAGAAHVRVRHGSSPATTLRERVAERLEQRGVPPEQIEWDSWRSEDGQWTVELHFPAGGRRRVASWHFSRAAMAVAAVDDEARWFGEEDVESEPPAAAHVVRSRSDRADVYDVERDGGVSQRPPETDGDLMASVREHSAARHRRRGARRVPTSRSTHGSASPAAVPGTPAEPDESAVPLEPFAYDPATMPPPPAAHPRSTRDRAQERDDAPAPAPQRASSTADGPDSADTATAPKAPPAAPAVPETEPERPDQPAPERPTPTPARPSGRRRPAARAAATTPPPTPTSPEARPGPPPSDSTDAVTAPAHPSADQEPSPQLPAGQDPKADTADTPQPAPTPPAPEPDPTPAAAAAAAADDGHAAGTPAETDAPADAEKDTPAPAAPSGQRQQPRQRSKSKRARGRSSVPAWDDVMFGAKPPTD